MLLALLPPLGALLFSPGAPASVVRCSLVPRVCSSATPPFLPDGEAFARGTIGDDEALGWWRQTPFTFQLVVRLPEDASFKRDVQLEVRKASIALSVAGAAIVDGPLAHNVRTDASDWCATGHQPTNQPQSCHRNGRGSRPRAGFSADTGA